MVFIPKPSLNTIKEISGVCSSVPWDKLGSPSLPFHKLRSCSQDHKDLHRDFEAFPYRIFHGNIDARILTRVKDCRIAEQVPLSAALSAQKVEDLETAFFRDTPYALEVCKITGDLIALLLGVSVTRGFRSDMTLLQFVEYFTLVDNVPEQGRKLDNHPDALGRIVWSSGGDNVCDFCDRLKPKQAPKSLQEHPRILTQTMFF